MDKRGQGGASPPGEPEWAAFGVAGLCARIKVGVAGLCARIKVGVAGLCARIKVGVAGLCARIKVGVAGLYARKFVAAICRHPDLRALRPATLHYSPNLRHGKR